MTRHDALNYLPTSRMLEFPRRRAIYEAGSTAERLYLVLAGRVKVSRTADSGAQTLLRIAGPEDFFGAETLIPGEHRVRESAVALEPVQTMSWTGEEIQDRVDKEPRLALALCEYFGCQNLFVRDRIKTIAKYRTGPRVTLALLQLARSTGAETPEGGTRLTGLTHQAIADYVGTSREIVTSEMNRLRRLGYVTYSRLHTDIYVPALTDWIREQGTTVHTGLGEPAARSAR